MTTQNAIELAIEALEFCLKLTKNPRYKDRDNCIWSSGSYERPVITAATLKVCLKALRAAQKVDVKALRLKIKVACMDDDGDIAPRDENDKNYLRGIDDAVNYLYVNNYLAATGRLAGQEWQPIETAPRDGTVIRFKNKLIGKDEILKCRWGKYINPVGREMMEWVEFERGNLVCPTHWQPLPHPRAG